MTDTDDRPINEQWENLCPSDWFVKKGFLADKKSSKVYS